MTESLSNMWRTSLHVAGALLLTAGFSALGFVGCQSGGVGDPCIPEDEYRQNFAGFNLSEENIESRSFQCQTRICLVNHFQGRVSCPEGQPAPTVCAPGNNNAECDANFNEECTAAGSIVNDCDPTRCDEDGANPNNCNMPDGSNSACGGNICNDEARFCHCSAGGCPDGYFCDGDENSLSYRQCVTYVCSRPRQEHNEDPTDRQRCYVPGTDEPIAVPVCGQCSADSKRDADVESGNPNAVYCSCRCDVADGEDEDPNFNFCDCPEGYQCEEIRKYIGLGDQQLSGKYCIRQGTAYTDEGTCGTVQGWWDAQCNGTAP